MDYGVTAPQFHRFLQSTYYDRADDSSFSLPLVIIVMTLFAMLLICIAKKSSARRVPPREVILEQRRRQRALIRSTRMRQMGINPNSVDGEERIERVQFTAAEAEMRRRYLAQVFRSRNVQTVIEDEDLILDPATEKGADEEQPAQKMTLVRLPNRKPAQPDCVPNNCAICLESYAAGEIIVWSDNDYCQHAFHQDCVLDYLVPLEGRKDGPCPICRQPFSVATMDQKQDPPGLSSEFVNPRPSVG